MGIDVVGIVTDVGAFFFPPAAIKLQGIGLLVDIAGAEYQLYKASSGEVHLGDLTLDYALHLIEKDPIVAARFGRATPVIGIVGNLVSIGANISSAFEIEIVNP
jgi:hypothetical protein